MIFTEKCEVYEGEFKENKRHGKGIYKYNNWDVYDGEWVKGKREGKGKMTYMFDYFKNQVDVYFGDWKNDLRQGKGILKFHMGKVYDGEFRKTDLYYRSI